ncbi:MAG: amidohydrolase [Desulfobacteraceae bacterium]|nr:amidohydrolase [Desulfobacteraceae bacterium]
MILFNGKIHTQDANKPFAEAVYIIDNKIVKVGSNKEIRAAVKNIKDINPIDQVDLKGKLVLPGFTDSHFHFYEWAINYDSVDLSKAFSFKEMEQALIAKAKKIKKGKWILGNGFNESDWPENRMPDRFDLDKIVPDNPVCIWRCDLHVGVANSLALKFAGINSNLTDPPEGKISRDSSGEPTGVLRELALNLIKNVVPVLSEFQILSNMEKGICDIHALGLTSIHDIRLMGGLDGADSLKAWQKLNEQNKLNIRCHVSLPGEMTDQAVALGLRTGFGGDKLKIGHLKFFADGGMGARTAWMLEKYLDAEYGMPLTSINDIENAALKADAAGLSIMVHSIGDRANREIVSMFERIEKVNPIRQKIPHRIEHVQMIRHEDLERMGKLKSITTSCQPNNLSLDISMIEMSVGEKSQYTYMLKSILNNRLPLILSSDAPVCNPNPFTGIYSAVTRKRMNKTPENGWYIEQALTVEEAVKGYTISPAIAAGVDSVLGSISIGKFADIIVLEKDIYSIDPDQIADTKIDITIFDGNIVYER